MLAGKTVLIVGMMSERSIAYGIAQAMHAQGARLIFSCMERFVPRVTEIAKQWQEDTLVIPCDLSKDEDIEALRLTIQSCGTMLDALVHSVAFAPRDHLEGGILDALTREGFRQSLDVSVYTCAALTKALLPHINKGGSVVALSYIGAQRAIEHYNIMGVAKAALESSVRYMARDCGKRGIRVNAVSAGPVRTASAAGIKGMSSMLSHVAERSPVPEPVTILQIGNVCAFLCSELAQCVTGEVVFADNGYHCVGV